MVEQIPDAKFLRSKFMEGLAGRFIRVYYIMPDHVNRARGMEMYHRIAGNFAPVKQENKNIHFSLADLRELAKNQGTGIPPESS
jgi:hypothetical protein